MLGRSLLSLTMAIAMGLFAGMNTTSADTLKLVNSWPSNQTTVRIISDTFAKKLEEYTAGSTTINAVGPESIGPLELVEPLQAGIVDLIFTHPAYHAGTTRIGIAADTIPGGPTKWRSSGVFDAVDAYYNTLGLKVIAVAPLGKTGFRFVAKQAIDGKAHSFDGMKVRANATYVAIIEKLGGSPVPLSGGEIYSGLQNGVVDAAPWARTGMMDFKLHEVTSHVVQPDFGTLNNWMFMNLDKWNALDDATKAAMNKAAVETELHALVEMERLAVEELANLQKAGLKPTHMNAEEAANIANWMSESLWEKARASSADTVDTITAKARSAGLMN